MHYCTLCVHAVHVTCNLDALVTRRCQCISGLTVRGNFPATAMCCATIATDDKAENKFAHFGHRNMQLANPNEPYIRGTQYALTAHMCCALYIRNIFYTIIWRH